jgi:hypothetical protein
VPSATLIVISSRVFQPRAARGRTGRRAPYATGYSRRIRTFIALPRGSTGIPNENYSDRSANAVFPHYEPMSLDEIKALPINSLAAEIARCSCGARGRTCRSGMR